MNPSDDVLDIDCGRCGTPLKVRIADLGKARCFHQRRC